MVKKENAGPRPGFTEKYQSEIDGLCRKIDRVVENLGYAKDAAKVLAEEQIDAVRRKKKELEPRIRELKESGEKALMDVAANAAKSMQRIAKSADDAISRLKK